MTLGDQSDEWTRSRTTHDVVLYALMIGAFAVGLNTHVVLGALDAVMRDLKASASFAGWIISSYAYGYAIFAPLNVWLFRNWDRQKVLILSICVFTTGNVICALAPTFGVLILGRLISAFGAAIFTPAATALAADLVPPQRKGFALSLIFGGMTVAQAAGVPATSWIAEVLNWRLSFVAVAVVGLAAGSALWILLKSSPKVMDKEIPGKTAETTGWRQLPVKIYWLLSVTLLIVTAEFVVYSYVSLIIAPSRLGSIPVLPTALLAYGVGSILGNAATGILTDRFGPRLVLLFAVSTQTVLLVALVLFREQPFVVIIVSFLWGIVSYMYLVPIQHRLLDHAGSLSKLVLAANSSLIYFGIGTGSIIGGVVIEAASLEGLALTAALLGAASLLLSVVCMGARIR